MSSNSSGKRIGFFDVETTGLDPSTSEIIEIGIVVTDLEGNQACDLWGSLVSGREVPKEVEDLTGISTRDLERKGRPWEDVRRKAANWLHHCDFWAAYNAEFDIGFIEKHIPVLDPESHEVIDPLEFVYNYVPSSQIGGNSRSLEDVCEAFAIPLEAAHRAVEDADATRKLFFELLKQTRVPLDVYLKEGRSRLGRFLKGKDPFEALYLSRPTCYGTSGRSS